MEARRGRRRRGQQQRRELEGVVVRVGAVLCDNGDGLNFGRWSHGARAAAVAVVGGAQPASAVELEEETVEGLEKKYMNEKCKQKKEK